MDVPLSPLQVHSGYSLLRGPSGPARLVERAGRVGYAHLALTDVNSLCGATAFHTLATDAGITPLIGAELHDGPRTVVALADAEVGYENLCRIITRIQCGPTGREECTPSIPTEDDDKDDTPRQTFPPIPADWCQFDLADDLGAFGRGLHFIIAEADLAARLLDSGIERGRLWLGVDPATQSSAQLRALVDTSANLDLPLVATGTAAFADDGDRGSARLLAAIRTGSTFDAVDARELPHPRAALRAPEQLTRELADLPRAVAGNRRLTEICSGWRLLPRDAVFPAFACPGGQSAAAYLRGLCLSGMKWRYGRPTPARVRRMDRELALIQRMGFAEYFLVVWDIVQYARRRDVPVAGRGSGASSIVAYLLGITNVCPLEFDIPFERFLHERREDFPDLDVDFCWRIRDDVIDYAFRRWGGDRVAMVSSHNTFQPASAMRETAKALGLSDRQVSRLDAGDLRDNPLARRACELSRRIIGLPHLLSVHPGGIVIGRKSIDHYAPIQPSAKGVTITQYDKRGIKDIALVKLDLLGNRSLSTIRWACDLIRKRTGESIDVEALPPADAATIHTLQLADTVGCNQLESPAMRHLLTSLRPNHVRDVMKALALIRPGAASIGMKEVFVRRHRGLDAPPRGHPRVDEILRDTGGVMLYEDDVMLVAAALMGESLPQGDRFRKAVQKCRDDDRRLALSREFLDRCGANGVAADYAKDLWIQMAKFNAYSFCRAHAASYAMLAYTVAWLKTHHPLEFFTAALNNNQSMYHPRVYVEQAKRRGIRFLRPHVNRSDAEFAPEADAIRVGLGCVSGLGPVGVADILRARPIASLTDLLLRTRLGREEARALILCGALDFTARSRPALMIELDLTLSARGDLPRGGRTLLLATPAVPQTVGDYTDRRKYADERRILGLSTREHVLADHRGDLAGQVDTDSRHLARKIGRRIRIAGMLEAHRTTRTQKGRTMRFLTLDDEYGLFEVTIFPDVLHGGLDRYGPYVVTGKVERQYDAITVTAQHVCSGSSGRGANRCNPARDLATPRSC